MLQLKKESQIGQSIATNKTTNDHFLAKNKLTVSEPNFTKSEGKIRFRQTIFEDGPLDKPKRCQQVKSYKKVFF